MPIRLLNFVACAERDIGKLKPCTPCDLPVWLSGEQVIGRARMAVPTLPDDSEVLLVEAWGKFPRGAVAVVPKKRGKAGRTFAISAESVDVTNPERFREK